MKALFSHESVDDNLRFLILEVLHQVERTRDRFHRPREGGIEHLVSRDDYIDNLKSLIQRKVLKYAATAGPQPPAYVHLIGSVEVVTINLERIADFCINAVHQLHYVQNPTVLGEVDFEPFFAEVLGGLSRVEGALFGRDVQEGIQICRAEARLDDLYASVFRDVLGKLQGGRDAQSLVTLIFIAHYFERMGDSLLNIGEAIISACLGEPVKIGQFLALEDALRQAALAPDVDGLSLEAFAGTHSGHRIARVARQEGEESRMVIFKEGRAAKLREEVESVERWEALVAGIAPKVYSFHERGSTGAILFEYLPGNTFETVLLEGEPDRLESVLTRVIETCATVWERTIQRAPVASTFLAQLEGRLGDVFAVHPRYRKEAYRIGGLEVLALEALVVSARPLDARLVAPCSVFVHGDFNVDNIIHDPAEDRIRFIDLHRSRRADYVEDVSVFLVSNLRLQVFEAPVRRRIDVVVQRFFEFARTFARGVSDTTFEARLGLGLARSFATSTRFVLDRGLSQKMIQKSRYLLERLTATAPAALDRFELPEDILYD
jgi:phosphate uptake regulator/aminoglycoside phosphotransferase (APT) family kinase protein